jgi:hypothetical protein
MRNLTRFAIAAVVVAGAAPASQLTAGCSSDGSGESGAGVDAIIFIKRQHTALTAQGPTVDVAGGNGQVIDYDRYVPGGSLVMLSPPRPDGTLKNLTAQFPQADFNGADVSFDGKQAVFSMKRDPEDN